jgi:hypothetical protein
MKLLWLTMLMISSVAFAQADAGKGQFLWQVETGG